MFQSRGFAASPIAPGLGNLFHRNEGRNQQMPGMVGKGMHMTMRVGTRRAGQCAN
jgi:hypothetical protein